MSVHRDHFIELMRRTGRSDEIATVEQALPVLVDLVRDRAVLERLRLSDGQLMERLGGSP